MNRDRCRKHNTGVTREKLDYWVRGRAGIWNEDLIRQWFTATEQAVEREGSEQRRQVGCVQESGGLLAMPQVPISLQWLPLHIPYSSISNPRFLTLGICFNGSNTHSHKSRRNSIWLLEVTGLIRPWELTWCCSVGEMDSAPVISSQTIMWSYGWANYKRKFKQRFFQ